MRKVKFSLAWMLLLALVAFVSCKKDDDDENPILVEDGIYVVGDATNFATLDSKGLMKSAVNEADKNAARDGMYELFTTIEAGKTFYISEVSGKTETKYGPSAEAGAFFSYNPNYRGEQPKVTLQWGAFVQGTTTFTVPASGLYHIVIDKQLGKAAIIPVEYWAIIGGATPNGWSDSKMALDGAFDKTSMSYKITDLVLRKGTFKFRYSGGWKLNMDDTSTVANVSTVKVNTNLGGSVAAPTAGGADIAFPTTDEGKYTVEVKWTLESGYAITMTKTGTVDPLPTFGDMYIVGAATPYGWDEPGTKAGAIMHKCAGGVPSEGLYWKICYITGGEGFKISAAGWKDPNLGFAGVTTFDASGVAVTDNGGNMSIATSGMYIVVLDLRNSTVKVSVKAAEVYGIGDAFGGWTAGVAANKFTVDNVAKTFTSPALPNAGNIRMYTAHAWITDWWHSEFVVNGTAIEYRNDSTNDPTAVAGTAGQVITLHFDDNTGTIAK